MTRSTSLSIVVVVSLLIYLSFSHATSGQQDAGKKLPVPCEVSQHDNTIGELEVRVGLLVASRKRPAADARNSNTSSGHSPGRPIDSRLLTHVFKFLMNKLNRQYSSSLSSLSSSSDHMNITLSSKIKKPIIKFKPIVSETFGDEQESVRQTINLILKHQVHVILGPQDTCQLEPTLASIFNVPMISHYCNSNLNLNLNSHETRKYSTGYGDGKLKRGASSTFIETKPPSWKIVQRVVALVRQLLSSVNNDHDRHYYYPQQLVLLYFRDQQQQQQQQQQLNSNTIGQELGASTGGQTRSEPQVMSASIEANQYNTIGRLLEIELSAMLRDLGSPERNSTNKFNQRRRRRRQKSAASLATTQSPSLSVLNWHTTFHYGYTENPFRRLVRRHLFASNHPSQQRPRPRQQSDEQRHEQQQQCSAHDNNDDQAEDNNSARSQRQASPTTTSPHASQTANRTFQRHPASTYIIVGHSYEHLGLMLALDELGLLDFDGWPVARPPQPPLSSPPPPMANKSDASERPIIVGGRAQQWPLTTMTTGDWVARPIGQQARHRSQRQPSIVIGVDIEPHDERDDSVRFLRGLLMGDGADEHGNPNDHGGISHHQRPTSGGGGGGGGGGDELSSLASKYKHYMAIVPAKPINPTELLSEMRQFYEGHDGAAAAAAAVAATTSDAHEQQQQEQQTSRRQEANAPSRAELDKLTLRMLQFARLPMEAYYLHDSIDLLADYFAECLRLDQDDNNDISLCKKQRAIDECSQGNRMVSWFANRHYSGHIDRARASSLDAESKAEGLYSLVARTVSQGQLDVDETDEEFDIAQVGRFGSTGGRQNGPEVELTVEPASVHQVWLPLWCALNAKARNLNASESCAHFSRSVNVRANNSQDNNNNNDDDDDYDDDDDNQDDDLDYDQSNARLIVLFCAIACTSGLLALMFAATISIRDHRRNQMSCAKSMLECFAANTGCGSTELSLPLDGNGGGGGDRENSQPSGIRSECFSARDVRNFLHIVHNLLQTPESQAALFEGQDETTNDELSQGSDNGDNHDEPAHLTRQMANNESASMAEYSGSLRSVALKWQRTKQQQRQQQQFGAQERDESETTSLCGIARLRDQQQQQQQQHQHEQHQPVMELEEACVQAIDLHCYMFPFPSCKFVHWLTALHQLKEMLFKYQSSLSSSKQQFVRQSQRWADISRAGVGWNRRRRRRHQCHHRPCHHFKSRSMFQTLLAGGGGGGGGATSSRQSLEERTNNCATGATHNHRGNRLSNNRFKIGISWQNNNNNNNTNTNNSNNNCRPKVGDTRRQTKDKWMLVSEASSKLKGGGGGGGGQTTFFTGRHRNSSTVKLLLNKYKSTNECLCQLASLSHPAVVRLFGISLVATGSSNGVKSAQLIVEQTGRSTLRHELVMLKERVHLNASAHIEFKAHLWRAALTDLIAGLDYLHTRTQIGFHGGLCATTCLVTSRWRLKLTGFHVQHMRRSLGAYKLNTQGAMEDAHEADSLPYLASEVLAMNDINLCARSSQQSVLAPTTLPSEDGDGLLSMHAMRLADIYSLGFLLYELLVGQEPWSCVEQLHHLASGQENQKRCKPRNRLIAERARVDPTFRPPTSRLDKNLAPFVRDKICCAPQMRRTVFTATHEHGLELPIGDCDQLQFESSADLTCRLTTIKRLLESCWAQSPHERPQSLAVVWSRLETSLISKLLSASGGNRDLWHHHSWSAASSLSKPNVLSYRSYACADSTRDCVLAHYTQLVEETARNRLALVESKQQQINELKYSLLPSIVQLQLDQSDNLQNTNAIVKQLDCVYMCMFRFKLMPTVDGVNTNQPAGDVIYKQHHIEALSRLLMELDELIASFRGHLHLWNSQVDSMLRYTVCAADHLQAPPTPLSPSSSKMTGNSYQRSTRALQDTVAQIRLITTFAFELIDLSNRCQAQFQGHVHVRCSLHLGPTQAVYLLPNTNQHLNQDSRRNRNILNLARCILLGRTQQVADVLEQSCQPLKIQISSEFRRELVDRSSGDQFTRESSRLSNLIPSLLSARTNELASYVTLEGDQQQQSYVMMRRTQKVQAHTGVDMETYWLLNGPRVTSSQRLMLPLLSARDGSSKSPTV